VNLRQHLLKRGDSVTHLLEGVLLDGEQRAFGRGGANRVAVRLAGKLSLPALSRARARQL
jgi:hypothetical protein